MTSGGRVMIFQGEKLDSPMGVGREKSVPLYYGVNVVKVRGEH